VYGVKSGISLDIGPGTGFKNFRTGAESEWRKANPVTSACKPRLKIKSEG